MQWLSAITKLRNGLQPTSKSAQAVLADFQNISSPTYGQIVNFLDHDFIGEGLELEALALPDFVASPSFLNNVTLPLPKAFAQTVHTFWTQLIRGTNSSAVCGFSGKCQSTFIPLNHTFVVPGSCNDCYAPVNHGINDDHSLGGRFREQYYWDSYWIVEGLIESELLSVANATLQNFMDELDDYGFIPNGGRIYCALSHFPLSYFPVELILGRLEPVSATFVYPGMSPPSSCFSSPTKYNLLDVSKLHCSKWRYEHPYPRIAPCRGWNCTQTVTENLLMFLSCV